MTKKDRTFVYLMESDRPCCLNCLFGSLGNEINTIICNYRNSGISRHRSYKCHNYRERDDE